LSSIETYRYTHSANASTSLVFHGKGKLNESEII